MVTLANSVDADQPGGRIKLFDTRMVFLKEVYKNLSLEKSADDKKLKMNLQAKT